jgi:hypothetical protein
MNRVPGKPARGAAPPEPAWEVAYLFPAQGHWSEEEYLSLDGNRMVEFSQGRLEVLPMPTTSHQLLVAFLYGLLSAFVSQRQLGTVLFAPVRVRLWAANSASPILFTCRGSTPAGSTKTTGTLPTW